MISRSKLHRAGIYLPEALQNRLECEENGKKVVYVGKLGLLEADYGFMENPDQEHKWGMGFQILGHAYFCKQTELPKRKLALRFWPPGIIELDDPAKTEFRAQWSLYAGDGTRIPNVGINFLQGIVPDRDYMDTLKEQATKKGVPLTGLEVFDPLEEKLREYLPQLKEKIHWFVGD